MSMSFDSRPIRRSRTQPPTISARPPASPTAPAIARARSIGDVVTSGIQKHYHGEHRFEPRTRLAKVDVGQISFHTRMQPRRREDTKPLLYKVFSFVIFAPSWLDLP